MRIFYLDLVAPPVRVEARFTSPLTIYYQMSNGQNKQLAIDELSWPIHFRKYTHAYVGETKKNNNGASSAGLFNQVL